MAVYADNAGALGTQIAGTANGNTYQTTTTMNIAAGANAFVWTVYAAPTGLQAFNRFDALLAVIDSATLSNNNEVHDELYSGYIVQTKSYDDHVDRLLGRRSGRNVVPGRHLEVHDRRAQHRGRRERHDARERDADRERRSRSPTTARTRTRGRKTAAT